MTIIKRPLVKQGLLVYQEFTLPLRGVAFPVASYILMSTGYFIAFI